MKRYLFLFILFLLPAQAFLENLSDSDKVEDTVISGCAMKRTCCYSTVKMITLLVLKQSTQKMVNSKQRSRLMMKRRTPFLHRVLAMLILRQYVMVIVVQVVRVVQNVKSTFSVVNGGSVLTGKYQDCTYSCSGDPYEKFTYCDADTTANDSTTLNESCKESWSCKQWGECIGGVQTRECNDYNLCGTQALKPKNHNLVLVEEPYVPPVETYVPPTPVSYQEPVVETVYVPVEPEIVTVPAQTIDYKNFAIVGGIIVAVIIFISLSVVIVMHYMNAHAPSSNDDEMIEYVRNERRAGIDEEQIRASLKECGWHKDEIQHALDDTKDVTSTNSESIAREGFEPPTSGL